MTALLGLVGAPLPTIQTPDRGGGVYFIQTDDGAIKIGRTRHFHTRFEQLRKTHPTLRHVGMIPEGQREMEKTLHHALKAHRITGEWFRPDEEVLAMMRLCEQLGASGRCVEAIRHGLKTVAEVEAFEEERRKERLENEKRWEKQKRADARERREWFASRHAGDTYEVSFTLTFSKSHDGTTKCKCLVCHVGRGGRVSLLTNDEAQLFKKLKAEAERRPSSPGSEGVAG